MQLLMCMNNSGLFLFVADNEIRDASRGKNADHNGKNPHCSVVLICGNGTVNAESACADTAADGREQREDGSRKNLIELHTYTSVSDKYTIAHFHRGCKCPNKNIGKDFLLQSDTVFRSGFPSAHYRFKGGRFVKNCYFSKLFRVGTSDTSRILLSITLQNPLFKPFLILPLSISLYKCL